MTLPFSLYDEPIEVIFEQAPLLEKQPTCPDAFIWRGETYRVIRVLDEIQDFHRRGKSSRNMRPEHASRAELHGSWGVGRFIFRVQVAGGRIFEIYYDRAPHGAGDRKGAWFLKGERMAV